MARPPLNVRRRKLRAFLLSSIFIAGLPVTAWAAMAVIDSAAIGKLSNQLTKMQEQIDAVKDVSDKVQEQIDAVGKMGKITLPTFGLDTLGSAIRRDLQCLKPDFSKLMPSIDFEDVEINSVCEGAPIYRDTLWVDPEEIAKLPTWEAREAAEKNVLERRERIFTDAITKAMAHADVAAKDVEQTNKAATELEGSLASSSTSNERLQVIGQGQIIIVRALAKQNQILAQLLKVQAAFALKAGVPVEGLADPDQKEGGE
ncbi:MAG: hypothetical protein HON65_04170 [Rhodospirillales bacterium]|nr:hypothetical protein [Rhodospirillales bacterium]